MGDACLRAFASRLQAAFAGPDGLGARLGGEEFSVLLRNCPLEEARRRPDSFRQQLAADPVKTGCGELTLSVSIGVATFDPGLHGDGSGLFQAADAAMYLAKAAGRNAVMAVGD